MHKNLKNPVSILLGDCHLLGWKVKRVCFTMETLDQRYEKFVFYPNIGELTKMYLAQNIKLHNLALW